MLRVARRFAREVRKAVSLQGYDVREELELWDFKQTDSLREWNCHIDRDIGGYSTAALEPNGKGWARCVSNTEAVYRMSTLQGLEWCFTAV